MHDPKRKHAKSPTYKIPENLKMQCFTPMVHRLVVVGGKRVDQEIPFIQGLLFAKDTREHLDAIVENTPKFQYRYKLSAQHTLIIIPATDMERLIKTIEASNNSRFYSPDEVIPEVKNRKIRIIGGQLGGYTGTLVATRDSKIKRLLVELPTLLAASIEVEAKYIQLIPREYELTVDSSLTNRKNRSPLRPKTSAIIN